MIKSKIMEEDFACVLHGIWSDWMEFLFSQVGVLYSHTAWTGEYHDESRIIPDLLARRWINQMGVSYGDLSDREKENYKSIYHKFLEPIIEDTLKAYYSLVCQKAELKMELTGKLEGAHYAAMREVLKDLGIDL